MSSTDNIYKPIFVIGTNRAGKELFMNLVSYHEQFAWLSNYNMRFPTSSFVSYLNRIVELPFMNSKLKYMKGVPQLASAYRFWNSRFEGFRRPFRDLEAEDISDAVSKHVFNAVSQVLKKQSKDRFIAQYSGWSRINLIKKIFPDAKFIHLIRDGRAVANSLINYDGWGGQEGVYKWRLGHIPNSTEKEFLEENNYSFLALAALEWQVIVNNIDDKRQTLPKDDFLLVRYEDLVSSTDETLDKFFAFCEIDHKNKKYSRHRKTIKIYNANVQTKRVPSWKKNISSSQLEMLNFFLKDELARFNYS
jgi:omega-hydroxy-beta-dihydromenaquinone-9 sulfotransferase